MSETGVFVDAENHADLCPVELNNKLARCGVYSVTERRAYADWSNPCVRYTAKRLTRAGFDMHHIWSGNPPGTRKDAADHHMRQDVFRVLSSHPQMRDLALITGDEFFADVAWELRRRGKRVILASDPCRVSKNLHRAADIYMPLGDIGRWILDLYELERISEYVTFGYAVRRLNIQPSDLSSMIQMKLVLQKNTHRKGRGLRPEIKLNRRNHAVRIVLEAEASRKPHGLAIVPTLRLSDRIVA